MRLICNVRCKGEICERCEARDLRDVAEYAYAAAQTLGAMIEAPAGSNGCGIGQRCHRENVSSL
jgi:hypothetical protein